MYSPIQLNEIGSQQLNILSILIAIMILAETFSVKMDLLERKRKQKFGSKASCIHLINILKSSWHDIKKVIWLVDRFFSITHVLFRRHCQTFSQMSASK